MNVSSGMLVFPPDVCDHPYYNVSINQVTQTINSTVYMTMKDKENNGKKYDGGNGKNLTDREWMPIIYILPFTELTKIRIERDHSIRGTQIQRTVDTPVDLSAGKSESLMQNE